MDIMQQCQKWHENNEHHKIIEALEGIEDRTPEMDSQLARAYNNEADHRTPEGRAMLKKAIALLKPHEEYFEDDFYWNFRMGYTIWIRRAGLFVTLKRHWRPAPTTRTPCS